MGSKKIAIISNSAFSLVNFRSHFIRELTNRGYQVFALAPDYIDDFRTQIEEAGAKPVDIFMERTGLNIAKDIGAVYSIYRTIKKLKPEVTFSYGIKPVIYGLWASRLAKVKNQFAMIAGLGTVYVERENASLKEISTKKIANLLYKTSLQFADTVFFQNPDDIQLFVENDMVEGEKTQLINGSGVDTKYYSTSKVQQDPITFTLVSRLIKEKGIYEFVGAARALKAKYPQKDIRFILLGDVDANPNSVQKTELESWVNEDIITWPGHVSNVKEWLEKTSVFVLPTYYREGTPKSILEAMSMGRPVITTDMPGCREAVKDGENGFLISPKDVTALISAMSTFIETPILIASMGKISREVALEKYDVRMVNEDIFKGMGIDVNQSSG